MPARTCGTCPVASWRRESRLGALARELQEELGVQIATGTVSLLSRLVAGPAAEPALLSAWLVPDWQGTPTNVAPRARRPRVVRRGAASTASRRRAQLLSRRWTPPAAPCRPSTVCTPRTDVMCEETTVDTPDPAGLPCTSPRRPEQVWSPGERHCVACPSGARRWVDPPRAGSSVRLGTQFTNHNRDGELVWTTRRGRAFRARVEIAFGSGRTGWSGRSRDRPRAGRRQARPTPGGARQDLGPVPRAHQRVHGRRGDLHGLDAHRYALDPGADQAEAGRDRRRPAAPARR